jgi:ribosomal-protein-alanine N-acetyltransferase
MKLAQVFLSPLTPSDCKEFLAAVATSRRLHSPWVTPPPTSAAFKARLERMQPPANYAFAIRKRDDDALVGYADITNVVRGPFLSAYLGYYAFHGYERQGLMTQGLKLVIRYAFSRLGLHRLEANIQPTNVASIALVRTCGFSKEGYSARYLKIRGRWRDHERWALLVK